ncbi:MAG: ion channel [Bacteroidota bacterium]
MKREASYLVAFIGGAILLNWILVWAEGRHPDGAIDTYGEAIWYMAVTLTTVGYGDLYPISTIGKVIGYIYVFASIGLLGILLGSITTRFNKIMEERKLGFKGTDFENHLILYGWNDFCRQVLNGIQHTHIPVCIVTSRKDDVDLIYEQYGDDDIFVLFSDYQNAEAYDKINADQCRVVFLALDDDSDSLMHVINFRKHAPQAEILVATSKSSLTYTFEAAGVTRVVPKNDIVSNLVASYIFEPDVAELNLDLMQTTEDELEYDVMEFKVLDSNPYLGKNGHDIFHQIKDDHDAVLLAISQIREGKRRLTKNPSKECILEAGDFLVLMANKPVKDQLEGTFGVTEGV